MVVRKDNTKEKEYEDPGELERRKNILAALSEEPAAVLSLAYIYAKGYDLGGEDVTERWKNATMQTDALNRAYRKGFDDAMAYIKEQNTKAQVDEFLKGESEQWE